MDANQVSFPVKQLVKKIEKLAFFVLEVEHTSQIEFGGWRQDCKAILVSQVDLNIGDHHMENNQGFTKEDFDKFFSWRGEFSDWWHLPPARYQASHVIMQPVIQN